MHTDALIGGFDNAPLQSSAGFRAALSALARPGRIETIEGGTAPAPVSPAAATLMLVLCDAETPIYLAGAFATDPIRQWIAFHIGAPISGAQDAAFALGRWEDLTPLSQFPIGTPEYPDRSTTLIVEVDTLVASGAQLSGPGIKETAHLNLPEVDAFRANRTLFPQGLDFFLTCDTRLAGLPRSTCVEAS